ncbi:MAG TPA: YggS family pyridoxal phosphate-dependent enzyme [bacterium]|nr:YggS family pyridoxal phosphate-dependent enzyme [bacterium]
MKSLEKQRTIEQRLTELQERMESAAARTGRSGSDIEVIAVTKTHPVDTVLEAIECGITHFAENRVQEAEEKIPQLGAQDVTWHMVGHLQRNKAKDALGLFHRLHSLDSKRLARRIQLQLEKLDMTSYPAYVQVNTSGEKSKYGILPDALAPLLDLIARECPRIRVEGLMTIAPYVDDEAILRKTFRGLRELRETTEVCEYHNVELRDLSMGMTNDYEIAIEEGATHLRIGRAIFGKRRSR